jgi:hypothetical protein
MDSFSGRDRSKCTPNRASVLLITLWTFFALVISRSSAEANREHGFVPPKEKKSEPEGLSLGCRSDVLCVDGGSGNVSGGQDPCLGVRL